MTQPLDPQHIRMAEALLFAAAEPLDEATLKKRLPEDADLSAILENLTEAYKDRGVNLKKLAGRWLFVTAPDLAYLLEAHKQVSRKLSRAAVETLAIIAYHQPITRNEIEEIRGVSLSKGTLDVLMETSWVRIRGRRRVPGRPLTYGTNDDFLLHFGLETLHDLPGLEDLKAAGLLELQMPMQGGLPLPGEPISSDEDPLEEDDDGSREYLDEAASEAALEPDSENQAALQTEAGEAERAEPQG